VRIAIIWGFPVQLSLWKLVYWLWRYKLNKVCDTLEAVDILGSKLILSSSLSFKEDKATALGEIFLEAKEAKTLLKKYLVI